MTAVHEPDDNDFPEPPPAKRRGRPRNDSYVQPDEIIHEDIVVADVLEELGIESDDIGGGNANQVRKLTIEEKKRAALALRLGGATYEQIGKALNVDNTTARRYVVNIMNDLKMEGAEELKRIQFMRLEHMLMLKWPEVQEKKDSAMNMALAIMDRQTRLLGLDAPVKSEVSYSGDVMINVGGDKDSFINSLKKAREQIVSATTKQRALEAGEIIEAEVVDERAVMQEAGE